MNDAANPDPPSSWPEHPDTVGAGLDFSRPDSKLAPYYFETPHVLAVLLIGLIATLSSFVPLWHTDVWAHLRYGEWMLEHRTIPQTEPFSPWWDGSIPFTQFYTLSQTTMVLIFRIGSKLAGGDELNQLSGGIDALRTLHGLLNGLRLFLLWLAFRRLAQSPSVAISGLIMVILIDSVNIAIFRPQVFSQVFFALLLFFISAPTLSWRVVLGLPLLLAVWANTHGSYIVALAVLGLLLLGRLAEQLPRGLALLHDQRIRQLLVALVGSLVLIGVLNPYGFSYYSRTLALTSHTALNLGIEEWQPLVFTWRMGWHWVLILTLVVLLITLYRSPVRLPVSHLLMILLIGGGMALQQRFVIWWAMLVPWMLIPHWAALQAQVDDEAAPATFRKTLLALAVGLSLFMWSTPAAWVLYLSPTPLRQAASAGTPWQLAQLLKQPDALADPPEWAEPLNNIIQTNYPEGRFAGTVFASPTQGDFLLWAIAPDIPVTYTHMHLFPPKLWNELGRVAAAGPGWQDVLERYGVNLLVFEPFICPKLIPELENSPDWLIVLNESRSTDKVLPYNRQFIAIRKQPLLPKASELGGLRP